MAGIYLHIPFCKSRCSYCDFFSVATLRHKEPLLQAMVLEVELTSGKLHGEPVSTIYFGGGTPSLLDPMELAALLSAIHRVHRVDADAEITLEANPDDVNPERLNEWMALGINRISIGVQSFDPDDLRYLDRRHDPDMAHRALNLLAAAPLLSFSVDLIYAIPGQSARRFEKNLLICKEYEVPHLSCYCLTVEQGTPLALKIGKGLKRAPDEGAFREHWQLLTSYANMAGYLHYETSSLCLPGHFAKHNLNYWNDIPYLGLGPSAHSFYPHSRWWNHARLNSYIEGIAHGDAVESMEELSDTDRINEHIMTRLRTMWGINISRFTGYFGSDNHNRLMKQVQVLTLSGNVECTGGHIRLTDRGKPIADNIISSLFFT
jgi:oxygen-independent coproporphyrinogen III oxidase